MSLLDTIEQPKDRPAIITICGDAGVGKTSLAALFPKPIVIRAEDGLQVIPKEKRPPAFPILQTPDQLWDQLNALIKEDHDFKTLVIDSVTTLERMFIQDVVEKDSKNPKSINQALGGYGAGTAAVGSMHQRIRKAAGILNTRKNMFVMFIAHAETETIDLPDQEPYTRYNLRLGKKSAAPYTDEVDLVGFLKLKTFTRGDDDAKKKAVSDGTRVLIAYSTPANISKNRYGINEAIDFTQNKNPLTGLIPFLEV